MTAYPKRSVLVNEADVLDLAGGCASRRLPSEVLIIQGTPSATLIRLRSVMRAALLSGAAPGHASVLFVGNSMTR